MLAGHCPCHTVLRSMTHSPGLTEQRPLLIKLAWYSLCVVSEVVQRSYWILCTSKVARGLRPLRPNNRSCRARELLKVEVNAAECRSKRQSAAAMSVKLLLMLLAGLGSTYCCKRVALQAVAPLLVHTENKSVDRSPIRPPAARNHCLKIKHACKQTN